MTRFGHAMVKIDERIPGIDLPLMSVSQTRGVIRRSELTDAPQRAESLDAYKVCRRNDIVFNKMSIRAGAMGVVAEDGLVTYHYEVMRPREGTDPIFIAYLMKSSWFTEELIKRERGIGAGDQANVRTTEVPFSVLKTIDAYLPGYAAQRAIADYLDRETARIDTLIKEQQRLIEMLRERRQAVIDESFSTLGEPSVQLRRYIKFLTSGSRGWGGYYADQGERFLRIGNLPRANLEIRGDIQFVDLPTDVTEGSRTMLQESDLLFSITAYLGSVAVVEGDWVGAYVSQHVALCRLERDQVDPRFIGWFMLTTTGQHQLNEGAAGGTKMQLALDDIRGLRVPTAPIEQQHRIAAHLDVQTTKIDTLIVETERFIELARERRSALITAAVTGQIDVRKVA
ncbi:restriction endonuclease subunit S [Rhodococcus sp. NPDC003318]|uniref:restriction endonuclease subunit S n=1 Tax=Rhodococcus sp. NPDC003318 TaxID=3364503 RepID=UPI0036CE5892